MPVFEFIAIDDSRAKKQGLWSANSARQARDELRSDGLQVVSIKEQATQGHQENNSDQRVESSSILRPVGKCQSGTRQIGLHLFGTRPIKASQLTGFVGELATMLSVNNPLRSVPLEL